MPWRAEAGKVPDPYRVWLSEIMLQQTTVATVGPYFTRFLERFPTVDALAAAPSDDVMAAWAGLGYYARARNLHECAKRVVALGGFPRDLAGLRTLPGIGAYTAAAVASIAFGIPVIPVDGNVERVAARVFAIADPLPAAKPVIAQAAARLGVDEDARRRPADFTQALFDLGATICTPRSPACALCPWRDACGARVAGNPERLPVKAARRKNPIRYGAQFWLEDEGGLILLRRRPPSGLLGGMLELPGTAWRADPWPSVEAIGQAPQLAVWQDVGIVRHVFTHFDLILTVYRARVHAISAPGMSIPSTDLDSAALPTVMRRCAALARR